MGSQTSLTISIVMVALFTLAIMGFAIIFATDNDASMSIADSSEVSAIYSSQSGNLSSFKTESESTFTSILDTTVEPGSNVIPSSAPFSLTSGSLLGTAKNVITLPITYIFGGWSSPFAIFFTTLLSIVSLLFILYIIKTWKGNP